MCANDLQFSLNTPPMKYKRHFKKYLHPLLYITFALGVAFYVLSIGGFLAVGDVQATWHHWGAFIGPAQLIAAGALPLVDIPLQYGFGPSLILTQGCKINCWSSMYWFTSLSSIAMVYLLAAIALKLNRSRSTLQICFVLIIVMASCLLWTQYPATVGSPLSTPSTTGVRFLPGIIMLAYTLHRSYSVDLQYSSEKIGHILWLACIFWSPEAGIQSTAVWVPYFIWTRTFKNIGDNNVVNFFRTIALLLTILLLGLAIFAVVFQFTFGSWPLPKEYIIYLLNVPGSMPINPNGTVWFAIACLMCWLIGFLFSQRKPLDIKFNRASWLIALLCLANFTYFLGRSHDNNILNLMPYLTILLFATRAIVPAGAIKALTTTLLSATLGFVMIFGWALFHHLKLPSNIFAFPSEKIIESFNRETNNFPYKFLVKHNVFEDLTDYNPTDAAPALKYIRNRSNESVAILDRFLVIDSGEIYPYWSIFQVPTNFYALPTDLRRSYLSRVAKRLNKSGWVIYMEGWNAVLEDYDSVYNRAEELEIGKYKVIRYTPK
jgi:hypothetical protein